MLTVQVYVYMYVLACNNCDFCFILSFLFINRDHSNRPSLGITTKREDKQIKSRKKPHFLALVREEGEREEGEREREREREGEREREEGRERGTAHGICQYEIVVLFNLQASCNVTVNSNTRPLFSRYKQSSKHMYTVFIYSSILSCIAWFFPNAFIVIL